MSDDVLGTGAYGDPANPAQSRQDYNADHNITDDALCPSDNTDAPTSEPAADTDRTPTPDAVVTDEAPADEAN